jgi:hypothetical protein
MPRHIKADDKNHRLFYFVCVAEPLATFKTFKNNLRNNAEFLQLGYREIS